MINQIGRKLYYDKMTGNIILNIGERQGYVTSTTVEEDIEIYKELSERNRNSFDVLELNYGQYLQDFNESSGYRINVESRELEFTYPDPTAPIDVEPIYQKPLSIKVVELKSNLSALQYELMMNGVL